VGRYLVAWSAREENSLKFYLVRRGAPPLLLSAWAARVEVLRYVDVNRFAALGPGPDGDPTVFLLEFEGGILQD
jgi:hypothetical protein